MNKLILFMLLAGIVLLGGCTPSAIRSFNKGKLKYEMAEYQPAIDHFTQALSKGYKNRAEANYLIAESYRRSNRIQEAEPFYEKAVEANTTEEEAYFWYAYALKSVGNYEAAAKKFKDYTKMGTNFDYVSRAKKEMENLEALNDIASKKNYIRVVNLTELNTPDAEYSPVFFDKKLYFTSSRGAEKMYKATGTGFTDIYEYVFDGVTKFSGQAKRLSDKINTDDAHEATPTFSRDGKTMIFSRGNNGSKKGRANVDLYQTTLVNGQWTEPVLLAISDSNAWDSSPWIAPDGSTLYFSSDREGGNGGSDIYKAVRDKSSGAWTKVTNLGPPVNTRGNEHFPYVNAKGDFYFSSDGHPSFGALDLFKVVKDSTGKKKIENLGAPINSSYDDFGYVQQDSIIGYFTSNRPDGKGDDDIYEFIDSSKIAIVHYYLDATVLGTEVKKPGEEFILANAEVIILNEEGDTLGKVLSDSLGKVKYEVQPETNYTLVARKDSFITQKVEFSTMGKKIPKEKLKAGENNVDMEVKIVLPKIEIGLTLVIDNIYYDFNKADIRPDAAIELYKIVEFLRNNPQINIELSSHTDARGSAEYNRKLAQKRAESAVNYIVSKGIPKDRITAKGYGEDKPLVFRKDGQEITLTEAYINSQPTKEIQEELHQKNRRTEITITNVSDPNIKIKKKGEEDNSTLQIKRSNEGSGQ